MYVIKAANQECELETYEDKKIRSQKNEISQWKMRKERLMNKAYSYMVWLRKPQKNL